jgi:hypothetical protein
MHATTQRPGRFEVLLQLHTRVEDEPVLPTVADQAREAGFDRTHRRGALA